MHIVYAAGIWKMPIFGDFLAFTKNIYIQPAYGKQMLMYNTAYCIKPCTHFVNECKPCTHCRSDPWKSDGIWAFFDYIKIPIGEAQLIMNSSTIYRFYLCLCILLKTVCVKMGEKPTPQNALYLLFRHVPICLYLRRHGPNIGQIRAFKRVSL